MHTRDYSDETSRVIDEEVERILREQEVRATEMLRKHRKGLDAVAAALLEHETIDGLQVSRLVDDAHGAPVHPAGHEKTGGVPSFGPDNEKHGGPEVVDETQKIEPQPQPAGDPDETVPIRTQ